MGTTTSELGQALESIHVKLTKYDPTKPRPIGTSKGTMDATKFTKIIRDLIGPRLKAYPEVFSATLDVTDMEELVRKLAEEIGVSTELKKEIVLPPEFENVTLNYNLSAKGRDDRFFLTYPDETVPERLSGESYILCKGLNNAAAMGEARKVVPEYLPYEKPGIIVTETEEGKPLNIYNTYTQPPWTRVTENLPDKLPPLFEKLVKHLIPSKLEREFFFSWVHRSMFDRAYTFLVLCGAPGTGKNRMKLALQALHGARNTVDGKKSTLQEKFNGQLVDCTLTWFDELKYDSEMENVMKEMQNDSISVERKGVDATRSTPIYTSIVISNNEPRHNYLFFDSRKFVPLRISDKRLEKSMTPAEIEELSKKLGREDSPEYDRKFIAQIAHWIEKHGASDKWPHLEYRGPMFWALCHTSMRVWQKKAAQFILTEKPSRGSRVQYVEGKGFLWSSAFYATQKKNGDRSQTFPDFTTVRYFFEAFRDSRGEVAFATEIVPGDLMGDFYVKPLKQKTSIVTETQVLAKRDQGKANEEDDEEFIDL